jgi:MFS family permease
LFEARDASEGTVRVTDSGRTPTSYWRNFGLILGVNVLWLPLSMLFNSLQSLVVQVNVPRFVPAGLVNTAIGAVVFLGLAGALIQPVVGSYSDRLKIVPGSPRARWGWRTPIIAIGVLLTLIFLACFALATNLIVFALAYMGVLLAAGVAQAGFQGLMPDLVPAKLRGNAAGMKGFIELLGSTIGFVVAGMLIKKGQPLGVVVAIGILLLAGTLLMLALVREGRRMRVERSRLEAGDIVPPAGPATTLAQQSSQEVLPPPASAMVVTGDSRSAMVRAILSRVLISRFLFLLAVYGIGHFLVPYMGNRLHMDRLTAAAAASTLFTISTVVTAVVAISGGALSDRVGRLPLLWIGAGLSAVGVLALIPATSLSVIYAGALVMAFGSGLFASADWALTADITPKGAGGRFFGLYAIATGGASAVAGLLGPVLDLAGYTPLFVIAALAFGVSGVVLPRAVQMARAAGIVPAA